MKKYFILLVFGLVFFALKAQQNVYSAKHLRVNFAFSPIYEGYATGSGYVYGVGWEQKISRNGRLRIHPFIRWGEYAALFITDIPDFYFRSTELGLTFHYDLIKISSVSLVTSAGIGGLYERGIGDRHPHLYADLFGLLHSGVSLRWDRPKKPWAYELTLLRLSWGTDYFIQPVPFEFSIIYKFRKRD